MKIPNFVKVCGIDYNIVYKENLNDGTSLLYGQIDFGKCEIRLSSTDGVANEHRCITLIHEILHGICENYSLEIGNEEKTVDALARGLFQVIKDNPEMFREDDKRLPGANSNG